MLFFATAIQAQMLPQTITADTLMARMDCPDANCANTFASNNHFFLKQKTNVGGTQHIYHSNETYKSDDGTCEAPDLLSVIMATKAVTEITYSTVTKSTYSDIVNYFIKYDFRTKSTETEDGVTYSTLESGTMEKFRIVTSTETKLIDGKSCPVYTITIGFAF
jgi:hypothetical protein